MKVIEILDHVAPAQKKALATYANKFGAVALVRHAITWGGKGLLEFADTVVPRQFGSRCRFKTLSPQQRRLNVAERLVVAFRIAGKFGGEESQASAPSVVAKEILHRTTGGPNAKRRPAVMPRQSLPGVMIPSEDVRSRIVGKLRALPDFKWRKKWQNFGDVDGLRALICQILGQPWRELRLSSIQLSSEGRIIGKRRRVGADIAMPEEFETYVGLCSLDFAVEMICDAAEQNGLTLEERAYLLNALPRFTDSEPIFD